jgi:hypothetical protein
MYKAAGTMSGVKRKSPEEGHRTLRFFLAGDGTSITHKKVMTEKAALYGDEISQSNLWRGESGMAYNLFYMSGLSYGTPATSLTYKECEDIKNPVINAIPLKMGININA